MNRILVMHGVNLNLFGKRDPKHYGTETLEGINGKLSALAGELGVEVSFFQSNYEGAFVERIQEAHGTARRASCSTLERGPITATPSWMRWRS
ncbi:MAG: type II 3-dehydroquinate dehydratase [Bilophila wadsworthia]